MAIEYRILDVPGAIAGEDMSSTGILQGAHYGDTGVYSGQYLLAKVSPGVDDTFLHCSAVNDPVVGIIQNNPKSGAGVQIRTLGVSKAVAGAALVAGNYVGPNALGQAVAKTATVTGATIGNWIIAWVLEGAAAQGNLASVHVMSPLMVY